MNSQLINQLASERLTEAHKDAADRRMAATARQARESVRVRAGWALINAGLKLTGPPAQRRHPSPRPAGL